MKISYRATPILKILEEGKFELIKRNEHDKKNEDSLVNLFRKHKERFMPVIVFSKTMLKVLGTCVDKMIVDDIWNRLGNENGTLVCGNYSFCFDIQGGDGTGKHNCLVYVFFKEMLLAVCHQDLKTDNRVVITTRPLDNTSFISFDGVTQLSKEEWVEEYFSAHYSYLVACLNFLRYADVQEKHIKPKEKFLADGEKNINETNSAIRFITSHYITNLYVEGAFKVQGHWRLQPKKKDGEWTKELIWINDFEKHGYTRKAGILKENQPA